jgi:hypothetical protein
MQRKRKKGLQIICALKARRGQEMLSEVVAFCQFFFPSENPFSLFDVWVFVCLFVCLFVFAAKRDGGLWDPKNFGSNMCVCVCVCVCVCFVDTSTIKIQNLVSRWR